MFETPRTQKNAILTDLMITARHLILQEMSLRPSGEWMPEGGWTVVRVADGAGYCLQASAARELNIGDMAVVGPNAGVTFRASQLGVLRLEYFHVLPQCLNGLLTVTEWRQLEDPASEMVTQVQYFAAADPAAQKFARLAAQSQRDGLAVRSALLHLWAGSITALLPSAGSSLSASNLRERFRLFVGRMSEAELAVRPLTQLAGELHCSERHFSRLFREEFHVSLRARQTELRLQRARQLLAESDDKIINVAYESGYRHLGLFNAMFKRRFGLTPSQWRQQNLPAGIAAVKRSGPLVALLLLMLQIFCADVAHAQPATPPTDGNSGADASAARVTSTNAPTSGATTNVPAPRPGPATNAPAAKRTEDGPRFRVDKYLVSGNTILPPGQIGQVLSNRPTAFGPDVGFGEIRSALADLQMAYRERGYVTVSVWLPQQRLTNAEVKIKVTEGRLADIKVEGNKWFSTANVLRALPGLHTNMLLNSHVFQGELDQANGNRDRQIYPVVGPGPDPGTTELTLKVKDRFPLHARVEYNDISTPGTPYTRANFNAEYDNLWQLEHQVGLSYNFSPFDFHGPSDYFWWAPDTPLVANYSLYYRMPLGPAQSIQQQIDESNGRFGYNEVTHQFQLPPSAARPEFTLYASRALSDTGVQINNLTNVVNTSLLNVQSYDSGQNRTENENVGGKLSWPLPQLGNLSSTLFVGADFKYYAQAAFNTNNFPVTVNITNTDGSVSHIPSYITSPQPVNHSAVYYVPLNIGINGSLPDAWGSTFFNAQANYNAGTFGGVSRSVSTGTNGLLVTSTSYGGLSEVSNGRDVRDQYVTVQMGVDRQQRLYHDWTVKLHADGQAANGALFSNEQYGMGGVNGVRGYQDGLAYGDSGWRVSVEPQTPLVQFGTLDGTTPIWLRSSVFVDYGQIYGMDNGMFYPAASTSMGPTLVGPAAAASGATSYPQHMDFLGTGWGITMNIGNHVDGRFTVAFPLLNPTGLHDWSTVENVRFYFALGAQF